MFEINRNIIHQDYGVVQAPEILPLGNYLEGSQPYSGLVVLKQVDKTRMTPEVHHHNRHEKSDPTVMGLSACE